MRRSTAMIVTVLLAIVLAACSATNAGRPSVRLGYFANVTHATAIVGIENGIFADALGDGVDLAPSVFNAGPEAVEAIFNGEAIRIVAGATSGGAALVVREGIATPEDLVGTRIATPQLGNTQDVALRAWLAEQGYATDLEGGGDVSIVPQANGQTLEAFIAGDIDGAWVPEPWATRLVEEGGGTVLVDEADLWPDGRFVTTHLIVATTFLEDHPDLVLDLLRGHVEATRFVVQEPDEAQEIVGTAIAEITDTELPPGVLSAAWEHLEFTVDPIASSLTVSAEHAAAMGFIESADLEGIYDLGALNQVLRDAGEPEIPAP